MTSTHIASIHTATKPLTISECAAKTLLAAWTSRDLLRLRSALAQTDAVATGQMPPFEQERFELLQEIARMMRLWTHEPHCAEDLDASLGLLRHLANAPAPGACSAKRVMAAPLFEMPVSVLH
jgi:hypothetical protein